MLKGGHSDFKGRIMNDVVHNSPISKLLFQVGAPSQGNTINGKYYDINFKYGKNSFIGF